MRGTRLPNDAADRMTAPPPFHGGDNTSRSVSQLCLEPHGEEPVSWSAATSMSGSIFHCQVAFLNMVYSVLMLQRGHASTLI